VAQSPSVIDVPPALPPTSIGRNTQLNLQNGGVLGSSFVAQSSSFSQPAEVNILSGTVGDAFQAGFASRINISGGVVGDFFRAKRGSLVNITGGFFGDHLVVRENAVVNISGGTFGNGFNAIDESKVHFFGTDFLTDGNEIEGLIAGQPFAVTERDVTLSGIFADGSPFSFELNCTFNLVSDVFHRMAL